MELDFKAHEDPLLNQTSPTHHFPSLPILEHLKFLAILLLAFLESSLIFLKCDLYMHFMPMFCIIAYMVLKFFPISPKIYVVDFACYKPPDHCKAPHAKFVKHTNLMDNFTKESVELMSKILDSSNQGQETYLPPSLHNIPPNYTNEDSIDEAKMVLFPVMEEVLLRSKLLPCDIDILIVNCSGLCPSPSLASIVVNKFKLRPDIKTFTLSGMGCSASVIAVGLAQSMLKIRKNCNVVILSTEILSTGWYPGNERAKLILNCIFRMGGAAVLLSNRKAARNLAKYRLVWTSRAQWAFVDRLYKSAFREEDANGLTGVTIRWDIVDAASDMIRNQLTALGSVMLPTLEKVKFVTSFVRKKYLHNSIELYVPNFKTIIRHFVLPTSGRPLIRETGKGLRLGEREMEPALATLHRFGNQSSSSLWYELAYLEAKERVKEGENIWIFGMGTGLKCASAVLECLRPISGESKKGPWADCIDRYPIAA